jgi:hypothetical protein
MKMYAVIGGGNNGTLAMSPRGNCGRLVNSLHQQPAKQRVVGVRVARQDNVLLNGQ